MLGICLGNSRTMPAPLTSLFVDLNSFFASVEQQLQPDLRGKPVAVVPMLTDSTCCIAASYEAKAFGVKTGTGVGEAKRLCPNLRVVEAHHERYVEFHHRIVAAVESCVPVHSVHSVDEMCCRLMQNECAPERAVEIAGRVKQAIYQQAGECMRCSIGIATNRYLAKVATDMQKPDGLVVIQHHDLPQKLHALQLTDLPGIASRMERQLNQRGIHTVAQLCALNEYDMIRVFHSIVGRYWHRWLRGDDVTDQVTHRRSIGHQHVLPPALRNDADARAVTVRLLHKAAARARLLGYWAHRLTLSVRHMHQPGWWRWIKLSGTQDTLEMIEALTRLWNQRPRHQPLCVSITLDHLTAGQCTTQPLFPEQQSRVALCAAMDRLNYKYRRNLVYAGAMHTARGSAPLRIAFSRVPDVATEL